MQGKHSTEEIDCPSKITLSVYSEVLSRLLKYIPVYEPDVLPIYD
jgi:hypothetical protein